MGAPVPDSAPGPLTRRRPIVRVSDGHVERADDAVAVERALEIRVDDRPLVVTLSSPGHDRELALGFLAGEGLLAGIAGVAALHARPASCVEGPDVVDVTLAPGGAGGWPAVEGK